MDNRPQEPVADSQAPSGDGRQPAARAVGGGRGRLVVPLVSALAGAALALAAVAVLVGLPSPKGRAELPVIGQAPQYRLTNQNGKTVSSGDFAGKVQIVTPMFPYCRELCPLVAADLAEFRASLAQLPGLKGRVEFVFFNVAPANADPAQMRAFLEQYGWDPKDPAVQFLTGTPADISRVVQGGFHMAYWRTQGDSDDDSPIEIANPLADKVKPSYDIKHADTIEVVDGAGRIRKIFSQASRLPDEQLMTAVSPLLSDGAAVQGHGS